MTPQQRYVLNNPEKRKESLRRYVEKNHQKKLESQRRYREKNRQRLRDENKKYSKEIQRYSRYGLTKEQYLRMLEKQNYECMICKKETELFIDHDHTTGLVRGLLCNHCNFGLGHFKDDIENLKMAILYLTPGDDDVETIN